ncbi:spore germination protein GerW family protein [Hymenobacter cellulosivorans]|uniref:Sporulation protein n=1 Tax=Hymenobacter cellulosivorans TaxID=2932249 RepID=A0ABY4F8W7_9BACT|nr:spore germination protein GerW family protein [Hymenobacter cellulosivorans]UOQ52457.1 hypothetical protein MUN80_22235 [Hymenobacter cellulosivorans]
MSSSPASSSGAVTASSALSTVEQLAKQLSSTVSAQAIYGTPVEREGVTVIPVARARYGFGGGGGGGDAEDKAGAGSGGGGGVLLTPVGYIEIREGRTRYRRISSSAVPLVAVSGLVALLLLRSVPKLLNKRG